MQSTGINDLFKKKNVDVVGVRRLDYFIVSHPEHERILPTLGTDNYRVYENTKSFYDLLSDKLVTARIRGLVPFSQIIDEKNVPPLFMPDRIEVKTGVEILIPAFGALPEFMLTSRMPKWEEMIKGISLTPKVLPPRFMHQKYRIVVCIEKATSKSRLIELCQRYGADPLIFSGQPSVTRVADVVFKAKNDRKPIAILYISDLDPAGWDMPTAFMKRVNSIYPNPENCVNRVALIREQAIKYNLPMAFDVDNKDIEPSKKERFIRETGAMCVLNLIHWMRLFC